MRKFIFLIYFFLSINLLFSQECTTMWPYLYSDFKDAVIVMKGGKEFNYKANVHVQESMLHYIEDGAIKEALIYDVDRVEIGADMYKNIKNQLMKVDGSDELGYVATLLLGDFDKLFESSGAYGSSSNVSAATKLSSLEIGGKSNTNYMQVVNGKSNGADLDLITKYFLVKNGVVYTASKSGISSELPKIKQAEFKSFLKTNKIKWKDPKSFSKVLELL